MSHLVTIKWWLLLAIVVMAMVACRGDQMASSSVQSTPLDQAVQSPFASEKGLGPKEIATPIGTEPEATVEVIAYGIPGPISIPPLPELEGNDPSSLTEEVQLGWQLMLTLPWSQLSLGVRAECPEPPLDRFTSGCNAPVPPTFPGSDSLPQAYIYYPDNPSYTLQRLFLSILPPAPIRLWQVVLTYPGDEQISLHWDFSWEGEKAGRTLSLRLIDAEGFIDLTTPGVLSLPIGDGRQTTGFIICSETLLGLEACPQRWP